VRRYLKRALPQERVDAAAIESAVRQMLADIAKNRDDAVRRYAIKLDRWNKPDFRVTADEIRQAVARMPETFKDDFKYAHAKIAGFAKHQRDSMKSFEVEIEPGIWLGQKLIPVTNVGCYIPGGKYPLISAAIMSIGTARAAGVHHIVARIWLVELASALVLSGYDVSSIGSLADLISVDAAKIALTFFWKRNGQRKSGQLHNFARLIVGIAKHWVKVPADHLEALKKLRVEVDPGKGEMTERNRTRLRVFDDPINVEQLINLPESMLRSVARLPDPGYNDAVRAQTALAIAIELVAPLRAKNLAGLRLDRHLVRSRSGPGAVMHLVIPPGEVKNKNPLEFELPTDILRLLELYLEKFRPLLVTDGSSYLFPARQGGAKTPAQLADQIKRSIKKGTGLTVNAHLFRHVCAFLYLKAHPGDYETVRLLLGHTSLATTVRAYCGLERSDAVRRYDSLIDTYRRTQGSASHVG